jgi:antitoxin FitA
MQPLRGASSRLTICRMRRACYNVANMSRMIQIRNVPEDLHRTLKVRAAQAGMTLSDYLLAEVRQVAERPSVADLFERARGRRAPANRRSSAGLIRQHRDA